MPGVTELLTEYDHLALFERELLQLLSVIYEPAHTALIVSCLRALDIKGPRGNRPTTPLVNHHISKLQQSGFLTESRQCRPNLVEILTRSAVQEGSFTHYAAAVQKEAPSSYYYGKWSTRCWRAMRELRIGIYRQDFELIDQSLSFLDNQCRDLVSAEPPVVEIVTTPFQPDWLDTLPPSFQFFLLNHIVRHAQRTLSSYPEIIAYLESETHFAQIGNDERLPFQRLLLNQYLLQGETLKAEQLLEQNADIGLATGSAASLAFMRGDRARAAGQFDDDLAKLMAMNNSETVAFFGPQGVFHVLSQIGRAEQAGFERAARQISIALSLFEQSDEQDAYTLLHRVIECRTSLSGAHHEIVLDETNPPSALTLLIAAHAQFWLSGSLEPEIEQAVLALYQRAAENGYRFFTVCLGRLLAQSPIGDAPVRKYSAKLAAETGLQPIADLLEPEEPWKRSLQALINISTSAVQPYRDENTRLVWLITDRKGTVSAQPREQKRLADGHWSRGRPISLARLYGNTKLPYLSLQDRKICLALEKHDGGDGQPQFDFNREKLLLSLIGHPLLFLNESPTTPVEFISSEPELLVEDFGEHLHINFSIPIDEANTILVRDTPTRFKVIRISDNHRRIARITGCSGLSVPAAASEEVLTAIGNISSFMTVHSAIAVDRGSRQARDITFVEADSTIYMHILPYGSGFRLEMFVKPFKDGTHYVKPGQGVEHIMAEVGGNRLQTRRDLSEEERKAREIEELCPILDLAVDLEQGNDREWHLHDPEDCLQALMELQEISDKVIIEWPEGEKLSISHQASLKNLNLKIRTNRQNWFGISGELVLDQELVIDLKDFLNRIREQPGRFVQVGSGQFIALTREFRKRLDELNTFAAEGADNDQEVVVHPLAAPSLGKLTQEANTTADRAWHEHLSRIEDTQNYTPELPSTLRAELRDYQLEGYHWLARLAHWGVGGCLADDMGLGKTLQSLAIILLQAANGPSLVVAPTSVSTNWLSEVARFTPTLKIKQLSGKNRPRTIKQLGKFDLLITTYTLLQQEIDALSEIPWQTIVLDEAQAIKNAATKRSQAAMSLQGAFKLITTGTPIENHLGELWNLFQFINPGLLGTHKQFNERFAIPIERFNNREARLRLKKLIRPFILRRIKSQVLEELPSRTEVTLEVGMGDEELHFYEALRQNALEQLERTTDNRGRHLQVLTEIMKLRQACCNPRLITADTAIGSSKLALFSSLIEDLIRGQHKVLVFSQFIGHLNIIREYLDKRKITYQYLDGSTSSKHRKERVEAFQSGEGDLFLISLKAGGLGLNLTAADYVIHMDPWWNPAVEDQASDRAHRIGQTRPVTIYRLVCKHTIEEKIVQLHQEKRDLADSLLEGTDTSGRLSTEELINLIKDN
jgi:SNF2 family DNA or RNA helicase